MVIEWPHLEGFDFRECNAPLYKEEEATCLNRAELLKKRVTSRTWIALSQVLANKSRSLLPGASYYYDYRHGIVFVIIICQSEMHFDSRSGQFGHKTA